LKGYITECRISDVKRSADWIHATYNSLNNSSAGSGFIKTVGAETVNNAAPTYAPGEPSGGATDIELQPKVRLVISDTDGDTMNVTWTSNYSGAEVIYQTNHTMSNGNVFWDFTGADTYSTKYYWKPYVDDGKDNESGYTYNFTTKALALPGSFAAKNESQRTSINLSWTADGQQQHCH